MGCIKTGQQQAVVFCCKKRKNMRKYPKRKKYNYIMRYENGEWAVELCRELHI